MAPSAPSPDRRSSDRRRQLAIWLFGIGVSAALLVLLYRMVDVRVVGSTLRAGHPGWLVISVGFIAPLTALRALRFMWIVPRAARPGFGEAVRMTLVAGTFNMFMPAKTGDLVKSVVIARHQDATASLGVATVVYERLADLFALLSWAAAGMLVSRSLLNLPVWSWIPVAITAAACGALIWSAAPMAALLARVSKIRLGGRASRLVGGLIARTHGWPRLHDGLRGRRGWLMLLSIVIGFLQLSQIWMFGLAVHVAVPFTTSVALSAAILLVGQLPLTFGGMGARDLAFVVLFAGHASPEAAAAMGLLSATRGILPALAGLLVMKSHLAAVVDTVRGWQRP